MPLQLPPTPHGRDRELLRDPLSFFLTLTRQYGDVVCYRPAPEPAYLINHPDYIRHVLVDNNRNYSKGTYINQMFKNTVGDGLLVSEGDSWLRQRRLMQPTFNQGRLARLDGLITSEANLMLERWQAACAQNQPVNLPNEMSALTLAITTQALFGVNLGEDIRQVGQAVDMGTALLERPNNPRFQNAFRMVEETVQRIIHNRRQSIGETDEPIDLLGMMMLAKDEDTGLGMDDALLRSQVMTLLLAGYDTTASALSWTFYLLSQHPAYVSRMRQELQTALSGRRPVYADLPRLSATRMAFEEALRLYPPAWVLGRVALDDDQIGEYTVPAGTIIAISPYTIHRHPAYWDHPDNFDPDRFTPERSAKRQRFAYIPFGGGPRQCIGNNFAMLEGQLIIAMVVQRFDLELAMETEIKPEAVFVLRPDRRMKIALTSLG
jgi:cytochrome P450